MKDVPEAVLNDCLDLLEHGQSIENIVARYPELASELRPFLHTATQLATLAPQPSLAAKQASQKAFLAHAASLKVAPLRPTPWYRLRQILLPLASLALVLVLFVTTAVSVSASAIPGDALYSVKRLVETVRLNQVSDPDSAVALMELYHQERIREVQALLRAGRSAEVMFEGDVEDFQTAEWTVASIRMAVKETTIIMGTPQLGEMARVNGRTLNGELIASSIVMLTGSAVDPESTATPEPIATPTLAPTEEPSETSTPVSTPQPANTASPTPTRRPSATPTPTSTVPRANDNDDSNTNDDNNNNNADNSNGDDDNQNDSNDNDGGSNNNNNNDNGDNDNENDSNDNGNDDNENDNDNNENDDNDNENDDNGNEENDNGSNDNDDSDDE